MAGIYRVFGAENNYVIVEARTRSEAIERANKEQGAGGLRFVAAELLEVQGIGVEPK